MDQELSSSPSQETQSPSVDVDAIMADIQPIGRSIPMSEPPAAKPVEQPKPQEFELDWKGQKIKADLDKLKNWAQKGYDYSQNMSEFKSEKDKFLNDYEAKQKDLQSKYAPYMEIDAYAQQNKDWWNNLQSSYQSAQQNRPEIPQELKSYLEPIINDYAQVKSFAQDYQKSVVEKQVKEQDAALDQEIKSIGSKYNLDLTSKDNSGQSLEQRVLNHANANGIPTFKAAFLDYYHDNLEKIAEARGKENVMNEIKRRKELGLLGESSTPSKVQQISNSGKRGTWGDIQKDILRELNLA